MLPELLSVAQPHPESLIELAVPNAVNPRHLCYAGEIDDLGFTVTPDANVVSMFDNGVPTWENQTADKDAPGTWVMPPAGDWVVASGLDTLNVWKKVWLTVTFTSHPANFACMHSMRA
jgi:hypothetical protein